jgi:hypothetical protein
MARMDSGPRHVLDRQVELLETGDLDALVSQYDTDAVVLRFDMSARGRDEIRSLFAAYLSRRPRLKSLDSYAESEDMLSYQATMEIDGSDVRTYGVFVLRGGRIWRQFAGVVPSKSP